jgi:predicted ATPase/class 3 adenylate cyclase
VGIVTSASLGSLMRRYRREAELTQEALAERAGVSVRVIRAIESGSQQRPRQDTVRLLLTALDVPADEQAAFWAAASQFRAAPPALVEPHAVPALSPAQVLSVLIADLRGYTAYTVEHGDEAGAALARHFAASTEPVVERHGGRLLELSGDEALCVFASARQALRAALALQEGYRPGEDGPGLPLGVGIGLDAGEVVPVRGGYRGRALNLAARLCALAGPGEVLASEGVLHLAGAMDGIGSVDRGSVAVKGLPDPVRVFQVTREQDGAPDPTDPVSSGTGLIERQQLPTGGFAGSLPMGGMVGREADLARVLHAVDAVAQGDGRLVLLAGEPGIGKTRLVQEVTVAVQERGFVVAAGRCYEPEQTVPYYPFLDVLAALWDLALAAVRHDTARHWPHLGVLLPEALPVPPASASPGQDEQQRVFRAVTGFLEMMAQIAPIALLLDDLHWADGSSLKLLRHVATHTRSSQVLLLGTYRDVEVGRQHPLEGMLLDLRREGLAETVPVRRLPLEGTTALLVATLGDASVPPALAERLHARTQGNPFFVTQVLDVLLRGTTGSHEIGGWDVAAIEGIEVPESIRAAVGRRLSQLSAETQAILHEAGVLGQQFQFDDLQQMTGRSEEEIEAALNEAREQRLLVEIRRDGYGFDHVLTQQVLAGGLPARRRRRLHRAAGEMLERLPDAQRVMCTSELAWHFLQADEPERAMRYALAAGDQAVEVFAHDEAEQQYRTAAQFAHETHATTCKAESLEKLGRILVTTGRYDEAIQVLQDTAGILAESGEVEAMGRIEAGIGNALHRMGATDEAIARLRLALDSLPDAHPSEAQFDLFEALATCLVAAGRGDEARAVAEKASTAARSLGDVRRQMRAEGQRGLILAILGRDEDALTILEGVVSEAERWGDLETLHSALNNAAHIYGASRNNDAFQRTVTRQLEIAERLGDPYLRARALASLGHHIWVRGDWQIALKYFEQAAALLRGLPSSMSDWLLTAPAAVLVPTAADESVRHYLEECIDTAQQRDDAALLAEAHARLAEYELASGHADVARLRLEPLLAHPCWDVGMFEGVALALAQAILETSRATDDLLRVQELVSAVIAWARLEKVWFVLVEALGLEGRLRARQGDTKAATSDFDEALRLARDLPYPFGEARVLYAYGMAQAEHGKREAGRHHLEKAAAMFRHLGARLYTDQVREVIASLTL